MEDRETARMRKYGESKTTRIMMATVPHVTSGLGLRKFQTDGFLLTRVYNSFKEFLVVRDENVTNLKRHQHCSENLWGIMQECMWVSGGKDPLSFKLGTGQNWVVTTPWYFTAGDRASGTLLIRGWLGPRASTDVFGEEKILLHLSIIERRFLSRSACSLVTILCYPGFLIVTKVRAFSS